MNKAMVPTCGGGVAGFALGFLVLPSLVQMGFGFFCAAVWFVILFLATIFGCESHSKATTEAVVERSVSVFGLLLCLGSLLAYLFLVEVPQ